MKNKQYNHNMKHLLHPHKNKALLLCQEFEMGMVDDEGLGYGSCDTEVRVTFLNCLIKKLRDDIETFPKCDEWGLSDSDTIESQSLGALMTNRLKDIYRYIEKSMNWEITEIYEYFDLEVVKF